MTAPPPPICRFCPHDEHPGRPCPVTRRLLLVEGHPPLECWCPLGREDAVIVAGHPDHGERT